LCVETNAFARLRFERIRGGLLRLRRASPRDRLERLHGSFDWLRDGRRGNKVIGRRRHAEAVLFRRTGKASRAVSAFAAAFSRFFASAASLLSLSFSSSRFRTNASRSPAASCTREGPANAGNGEGVSGGDEEASSLPTKRGFSVVFGGDAVGESIAKKNLAPADEASGASLRASSRRAFTSTRSRGVRGVVASRASREDGGRADAPESDALAGVAGERRPANPNFVADPGEAKFRAFLLVSDLEYEAGGVGMRDFVPCLESSRVGRELSASSGVPGLAQTSATNRSFSAKNEILVPVFFVSRPVAKEVFPPAFATLARGAATVLRYTMNSSKPTAPSPSLSAATSCFLRNATSSAVSNALTSPTSRSRFRNSTPLRLPSRSASYLAKTRRTSSREWLA
jgi:hypothetical protein